ncbi:G-protein coupled receptor 39-like [Leucoraja erinacea]|uniref:G-protein coupled receptor 39-like n=1 Tax=Leucoraja erinaceus TaxID=7782 RepID=UPI002457EA0C|nr:G-protein coupled receptor 39-like [Leucoraja erinacea]
MNISEQGQWGPPPNVSRDTVQMSTAAKVATSAVYGTLLLSGTAANLLVIWVVWVSRGRTRLREHMASMACSDLLILTVGLPCELYTVIWSPHPWPAGNAGCKGFYLLWEVCSYASIFNVLTFSVERYVAICHPMRTVLMATSRTKGVIGLVWLTATIAALPVAFAVGVEDAWGPFRPRGETRSPLYICTNVSGRGGLFQLVIYVSFCLYLLVLLLVAFTCRQMVKTILGDGRVPIAFQRTNPAGKIITKSKEMRRQSVVMLGCIVGTLAICWFPFQARRLMTAVQSKTQWTEHYYRSYLTLQPITNTLYYISSASNLFLYNVTSRHFRKMFLQVLGGCCRSRSVPSENGRHSHTHSDLKREFISLNGKPPFSKVNGE